MVEELPGPKSPDAKSVPPRSLLQGVGANLALISGTALVVGAFALFGNSSAGQSAVKLPSPLYDSQTQGNSVETAVFAGGCFWGVQAVFQHTKGVFNAVSGYAGGSKETANYGATGSGRTGHAESVQISYDPRQISYGQLLQIYFGVAHDPTELNRQGPDTGTQYRSAIFYLNDSQKQVAQRYIAQLDAAKAFPSKIVTEVSPLGGNLAFYPAENYHQDYATLNPRQPYIIRFDAPKLAGFKRVMPEVWRDTPALVADQPKS